MACCERFQAFRSSKPYLLFVTFYSVTIQLVCYSVFHPILPFYLRKLYSGNVCEYSATATAIPCDLDQDIDEQVSRAIGIVTGTGAAMQLVASLFSGILLQKFSLHINLLISVTLNLLAPGLAFFASGIITICCANAAISAGCLLTFLSYYSILSERSSDDKERMRLVGLYNVFNGLGNVLGYSAASASYQFLGHKITFGILFGLVTLDLILRAMLKCHEEVSEEVEKEKDLEQAKQEKEVEMTRSQLLKELGEAPEIEEDEEETSWKRWIKYLSDPYVVLVNLQTFFFFISVCTLCTTAPYFVSTTLEAEQWQTGLTMGVGSCIELIMLSLSAALVTTHKRRWITIFLCCIVNAAGFFWYPFTNSVWEAMVPETFIRVSKAVGIVFIGTLYPYITECRDVGDCRMGYAIHGVFISVGATLGSYGSGLVVVEMSFLWLYVSVGTCILVASFTILPFIKLAPPIDDLPTLSLSRVSLSSWMNRSAMSVNNLHGLKRPCVSSPNLRASFTSIHSMQSGYPVSRKATVSSSRSSNIHKLHTRERGLTISMADVTLSRLSIGRAMAL